MSLIYGFCHIVNLVESSILKNKSWCLQLSWEATELILCEGLS